MILLSPMHRIITIALLLLSSSMSLVALNQQLVIMAESNNESIIRGSDGDRINAKARRNLRNIDLNVLQSDYGCDLPCNGGDIVYEIEAVVQRNLIEGNMKDYECKNCKNTKPFTKAEQVYATLRSFRATSKQGQSPYCEMMNGYNGTDGILGPCLMAQPGQTISLKLINNLGNAMKILQSKKPSEKEWWEFAGRPSDASPKKMANEVDTVENNPGWDEDGHVFDMTNIHFHGLEVSPHLFYPLGTSEKTAPWIQVEPNNANGKQCFCYQIGISRDQSPGTYLYHIHRHGSSAMQLWSGMLGLIQIGGSTYEKSLDWELKNEYDIQKDIPFTIWAPPLRYKGTASSYLFDPSRNNDGSVAPKKQKKSKVAEMQLNSFLNSESISISPVLVNNAFRPTYKFKVGEVVRFRLVCAFVKVFCGFSIVPNKEGINTLDPVNQLEYYVIASDGIALDKPLSRKKLLLSSAQRNDILVKFSEEGNFVIRSDGVEQLTLPLHNPDTILAYIEVDDDLNQSRTSSSSSTTNNNNNKELKTKRPAVTTSPTKSPNIVDWIFTKTPPRNPIASNEIVNKRTINFDVYQGKSNQMPKFLYRINQKTYRVGQVDTEVHVDAAEEWEIKTGYSIHSYHIHIMPFYIVDVKSTYSSGYMANDQIRKELVDNQIGMWRDTVNIPPSGTVTIRTKFSARDPKSDEPLTGKTVYHCHFIDDEDMGMMQNVNILP